MRTKPFITTRRALLALALLITGVGVVNPVSRAEVPELGDCRADAELTVGAVGSSVVCVQWALMWLGYYRGLVNGTYDQATSNAVIKFQQAHPPLSLTGKAGVQTLTAMGIYSGVDKAPPPPCLADAPIASGDRGQSTECLQRALHLKGVFLGAIDGTFGAGTAAGVQEFQRRSPPLPVTGVADTSTLAALGIWSGFTRQAAGAPVVGNWWPAGYQAEPNWRVNGQGIPFYSGHLQCSRQDADTIANEFAKDGADPSTQQFFIYIASREGSCRYNAVNINAATHDDSHCTFQINALSGVFEPNGELGRRGWTKESVKASMQACADAASDLWVFCARGPWTPPYSCTPPWKGDLGPEGDV